MARHFLVFVLISAMGISIAANAGKLGVRVKDLGRVEGDREMALTGYGIVVGLSGSGDSSRHKATLQSLANTLSNFGLQVNDKDLNARNVASVMITAEIPPFAEPGDRVDVRVASAGDAKSLSGGTLLLAPLYGPDNVLYALSQGSITVGGYQVESFSNLTKKNHTTVGQIARGATIERSNVREGGDRGSVNIILNEPDYTTADRLVNEVSSLFNLQGVEAIHPGKISIPVPKHYRPMVFIAQLENAIVTPDVVARVVVNERTGTIVSGGNVLLGEVSIAHGDLRIEVETTFNTSQPQLVARTGDGVQTIVTPETDIVVTEESFEPVLLPAGTSVGQLVQALNGIRVSTRDVISILQSIKAAGALHAELVIQ